MIPKPRSQRPSGQVFDFRRALLISPASGSDGTCLPIAKLFAEQLRQLGFQASVGGAAQAQIELAIDSRTLGPEEYQLTVTEGHVNVVGGDAAGVFYGTRTLLNQAGSAGRTVCGVLSDGPRYKWRGAHLDVARHFFSVEEVKRFIDLIALHKMNIFHWHLTEDQGWRIEIEAFPKLTEVSAYRDGKDGRYGGYYTKEEVRDVVAYAKERFVTVVPEIEMPGHAVAALAAYPQFSCTGGPFEVETQWGIFDDVYCAGSDETFSFLEKVLDEVIELFPSEFFHIGGDECPKKRWKSCPRCQARMRAEGLSSEDELQSWFIRRMSDYLSERGRRLLGWDEILEGGLAPGATVMSWRGTEGGVKAAKMNHDVVMSPTTHCYLDYKQADEDDEPGAWFAPQLNLETVYSYEPTPAELTPEQSKHVLGVQGNIWTEKMSTFKQVEYMTFPRLCALAEVAWSGPERDYPDFLVRLAEHQKVLDRLGVGYRGSPHADPELPTDEDRARFAQAAQERARAETIAAY